MKDTPDLAVKIIKMGMGCILGSHFIVSLNCHFFLFDHTWDTSFIYDKAKCVCFIYMQPQKIKFTSVQINMKQVSYLALAAIC